MVDRVVALPAWRDLAAAWVRVRESVQDPAQAQALAQVPVAQVAQPQQFAVAVRSAEVPECTVKRH